MTQAPNKGYMGRRNYRIRQEREKGETGRTMQPYPKHSTTKDLSA